MNYKGVVLVLIIFSAFGLVLGIFAEPGSFNLGCSDNGPLCNNPLTPIPGEPFLAVSISLLATSLLLLFARRETFILWAKFAVPAFIAMLAIIFYTYNNEPIIGGWVSFGSDDQLATVLGPSLFFLISLVIIAVKSYRLRQA